MPDGHAHKVAILVEIDVAALRDSFVVSTGRDENPSRAGLSSSAYQYGVFHFQWKRLSRNEYHRAQHPEVPGVEIGDETRVVEIRLHHQRHQQKGYLSPTQYAAQSGNA